MRRLPLRRLVEGVLILLLLVQAGRLVWLFVAPSSKPSEVATAHPIPAVDLSILSRFDAFFRTGGQGALAGASGADASQMRLFGVRSGGIGGGSAIIGLADGRQVSVGVGEEVEPGLVLQGVGPDYVTLARGQSVSRLEFADAPVGAAPPPPPPSTPQVVGPPAAAPVSGQAAVVDPQRLMAQASLRPRIQGLGVNGFTVSSAGNASELRSAGLQSGDVILSVNGVALNTPQAIGALRGQLASAPSAEIQYERAGETRTTTIRTRP
ncbi:type II secretion system protein N [Brevundimonas sp. SL130]|uniref:type II secretion system protein N n=1 Tax=Brevundimonas sp. SL130 TaxID=2995143 RepID=UPI00226C6EBB|nr:type II secretion system protein N [Brevundimonas sp. SL130]WAC61430.1 general secretion pathway protein [Brevundimonas sp. SL130]